MRTGSQMVGGALDYRWRARVRAGSRSSFRTCESPGRNDIVPD
jgi:hypothetical protein